MPIKNIFESVNAAKADIENLSVEQLNSEMADNPDLLVLDIRELQERVDLGTIPGSKHVPRGMLESGSEFPGDGSPLSPARTAWPTSRPSGARM